MDYFHLGLIKKRKENTMEFWLQGLLKKVFKW